MAMTTTPSTEYTVDGLLQAIEEIVYQSGRFSKDLKRELLVRARELSAVSNSAPIAPSNGVTDALRDYLAELDRVDDNGVWMSSPGAVHLYKCPATKIGRKEGPCTCGAENRDAAIDVALTRLRAALESFAQSHAPLTSTRSDDARDAQRLAKLEAALIKDYHGGYFASASDESAGVPIHLFYTTNASAENAHKALSEIIDAALSSIAKESQ